MEKKYAAIIEFVLCFIHPVEKYNKIIQHITHAPDPVILVFFWVFLTSHHTASQYIMVF